MTISRGRTRRKLGEILCFDVYVSRVRFLLSLSDRFEERECLEWLEADASRASDPRYTRDTMAIGDSRKLVKTARREWRDATLFDTCSSRLKLIGFREWKFVIRGVKWGNGRLNDRHETRDFGRVSSRDRENLFRWDFEMAVAPTSEHFTFNFPSNVKPWSLTFKFLNIGRRDGVKYGNSMKWILNGKFIWCNFSI